MKVQMKSTRLADLLAALFLSLTMLVTSCSKQEAASNASAPATEPAKAKPFQGQVFRTADDSQAITLVSQDELEMRGGDVGANNLICKYTRQDDTLRVVQTVMGTTRAVYYKITPYGLEANDGTVLLNPARFNADRLLDSGYNKQDKGDYDGAIADYNRALELDPKYALAYNNRGLVKSNKGDQDAAIADFDRALELDPKLAFAYNNRGKAYMEKGDYERAIQGCNRSIELYEKNPFAYNNRGWAYCRKRDYDRAWADVKKCRELGGKVDTKFLAELTQASGRTE
ncbi:MAG: tetratricopeptide repeat protein [Verrucomicrobia bacterium]|nr:tetratricopeptide repeat protein [Verrucomicrobiota bacterium]